jgi:quinol monooxygenase YgiN
MEAHPRREVGFWMGTVWGLFVLARCHDYHTREASILNGIRQISVRRRSEVGRSYNLRRPGIFDPHRIVMVELWASTEAHQANFEGT